MPDNKDRIMLVEDEVDVAEIVRDYLHASNYSVELIHSGAGVVDSVRKSSPDLILLDIMLPEVDGVTICEQIRTFSTVPVIMLTAKVDEIDRLLGYDLGVDDYICKPVNPKEILARVKAVLRRFKQTPIDHQTLVTFDNARLLAIYRGKPLDLTSTEFRLLKLLHSKKGRVLSRIQIRDSIIFNENEASDRAVDTCVKKLRKKIRMTAAGDNPIQSVYGLGYKFEHPE